MHGRPFKMRTLTQWLFAIVIVVAVIAAIANIDAFLNSRFPNP